VTPHAATQLDTIETLEEFVRLSDGWDDLVRAMPRPSPFLLHSWLTAWWRHYGDGATLAVHTASRDGELVGAAPAFVRSRMGISVTSFLGGDLAALADLLLAPDAHSSTAAGLAARIAGSGPGYLDVHGLPSNSRLAETLASSIEVRERVESPFLDLPDGWEAAYNAKTSSKKRNLHRRRRRQLGELGCLEVHVAREPETLQPALEEAFRLHELRWEGRPDGSDFASPRGRQFHRTALVALAELDIPRIVLLTLDGRAIAFHYYFAFEGRMIVHRLGFDPAFARYSPGLVNTLDTIETAASEGLTRVEFLGGAERYKVELADGFDPLCRGLGLARGVRAHALVRAELATIDLRLRLKRWPALRHLYVDGIAPLRRLAVRSRATFGAAKDRRA
jgi:CelD/BcsL family acetyltransferase involved in cellulose biosynthesis